MKLNKKHVAITFIPIIIVGFIVGYFLFNNQEKLELVGESHYKMMINSIYQEEGTNLKDVKITGNVDTSKKGTYEINYTYKKQSIKRTVDVLDNKQLVMNLNGSKDTYVKQNQEYIESGCHVIDHKEGNLTSQVQISGKVDTKKVGDYDIIYSVKNKDGVLCSKKRTVHVLSDEDFKENKKGIPVLMYHYVYTQDDMPKKLNTNYLLDTKLEKQLQYLKENNYYFPSWKELSAYIQKKIDLPEKSVVLTFDDGQKGFLKYGIPLLEKYQVPSTSFIIASKKGENTIQTYASEYISFQSHSYNLHRGGGSIGHGDIISALSYDDIKEDLLKAQSIVQNTEAFAYPYGDMTKEAQKAVKDANILCAFSTQYGKVHQGDDFTQLKRIRVLGDASLESYISTIN